MKGKRYYFNGELSENLTISLEGEEFHHLANVLRARTGDEVILFNGDGNFYYGNILEIAKKFAKIKIFSCDKSENEPKVHLSVFQALAKGDKLSLIMQKISEIGASDLFVFDSEFCDVKFGSSRTDRLENIAISASKQCGRATIVSQNETLKFDEVLPLIKSYDAFFVAYENEDNKTLASELIKNRKNLNKVAIMIGAEGGFSTSEIEKLKNAGAIIVSLGRRILRTETASIVTSGLIMQILETTEENL